jgi:hypothetical protein
MQRVASYVLIVLAIAIGISLFREGEASQCDDTPPPYAVILVGISINGANVVPGAGPEWPAILWVDVPTETGTPPASMTMQGHPSGAIKLGF